LNYFNYFSEIEETFIRRRGKNLFLSPLDWALIETWQEREVPLHIVLRGIEKVFDGYDAKPKQKRTIKSLMYCREEIEAQYENWLESQVGKNTDEEVEESGNESVFSREAIVEHLANVAAEIEKVKVVNNNNLRDVLERVTHRLAELKNSFTDAESLENDLTNLEKLLDEVLLETADDDLKSDTANQLKTYKKQMDAEVYQRTFELMLLKKLREKAEIPRISLFYL
jgi:hypothetical protein